MREHITGSPGAERNVSRARNHNVIRDRNGFVLSDYISDMPHKPLSDLKGELAQMLESGNYDNPRLDFLGYGEAYPVKQEDGSVKIITHGKGDGVLHVNTAGKTI